MDDTRLNGWKFIKVDAIKEYEYVLGGGLIDRFNTLSRGKIVKKTCFFSSFHQRQHTQLSIQCSAASLA